MANCLRGCKQCLYPTGFCFEFSKTLKLAFPVIATNLLQFLILTESIIMCGHLDTYQLGGSSLANSILNALGIGVGTGLCTACDTLFSQVYGSDFRKRMGIYLQRSMIVISLFPFFLWALHINFEPIFIYLGQDPRVAIIAANYMVLFTPGLFFSFHGLILARYMQNQNRQLAPMVCGIVGNIFNIVSQYICIYVLGKGYEYSAMCEAATFFVIWLAEVIYIVASGLYKDTWQGWSMEALNGWGQFVALALPGVGMITMETICWEIGTFVAGTLGPTWLGVQAVLFQLETCTFMISFGISVAVNIRVGQNLGAQNALHAKTCYRIGLTIVLMTASCTAIIFASLPDYLPRIFSDDEEVIMRAKNIVQLLGIFQIIDGIGTVTAGALRGCGRQNFGASFIFLAYYVFGLPIGITLCLHPNVQLNVLGLWVGIFLGLSISVPCMVSFVNLQNWKAQADRALERLSAGSVLMKAGAGEETALLTERSEWRSNEDEIFGAPHPPDRGSGHVRTPSQPYGPSVREPVPLHKLELMGRRRRMTIVKRVLIYLAVILFFLGGVALKVNLPRELYLPKNMTAIGV